MTEYSHREVEDKLVHTSQEARPTVEELMSNPGNTFEIGHRDLQSLQQVELTKDLLNEIYPVSEETRQEFRKMGTRGLWEEVSRGLKDLNVLVQPENFFPIIPKKGDNKNQETLDKMDRLEFTFENDYKTMRAVQRLQKGDYSKAEPELEKEDKMRVQQYLRDIVEKQERPTTFAGDVGGGVANMMQIMAEFVATGGVASLGGTLARKGTEKLLRKELSGEIKQRITEGVGKALARTTALPHHTVRKGSQEEVFRNLVPTNKGIRIAAEDQGDPFTSFTKGFADTFIDMFTEEAGAAITPFLKGVKGISSRFVPKAFASNLEKAYLRLKGDKFPNKKSALDNFYKKAEFNGFLEEIGEEYLANIMKATTGLEDFGAENPDSVLDRIGASFQGFHELAVIASVVAVPTLGKMSVNSIVRKLQQEKEAMGFKEPAEQVDYSDEIADKLHKQFEDKQTKLQEKAKVVEPSKVEDAGAEGAAGAEGSRIIKVDKFEKLGGVLDKSDVKAPPKEKVKPKEDKSKKEEEEFDKTLEALIPEATDKKSARELLETAGVDPDTLSLLTNAELEAKGKKFSKKLNVARQKIVDLLIKERKAQIERELKPLDQQALTIGKEIDRLEEELDTINQEETSENAAMFAKDKAKLEERLRIENDKMDALFEKIGALELDSEVVTEKGGKIITETKRLLTNNKRILSAVNAVEKTLLAEKRQEIGAAVRGTKKQIKETQTELIKLINESDLSAADKGKFLKRIPMMDSPAKLQAAIPGIQESIQKLIQRQVKRVEGGKIKKLLKKTKPTTINGKRVGKLGNDKIQREVEAIRAATTLDAEQTVNKLQEIQKELDSADTLLDLERTQELLMKQKALHLAGGFISSDLTPEKLTALKEHLQALAADGKNAMLYKQNLERLEQVDLVKKAVGSIVGGKSKELIKEYEKLQKEKIEAEFTKDSETEVSDLESQISSVEQDLRDELESSDLTGFKKFAVEKVFSAGYSFSSLATLNDIASSADVTTAARQSALSKAANLRTYTNDMQRANVRDRTLLNQVFKLFMMAEDGIRVERQKGVAQVAAKKIKEWRDKAYKLVPNEGASVEDWDAVERMKIKKTYTVHTAPNMGGKGRATKIKASKWDLITLYNTLKMESAAEDFLELGRPMEIDGKKYTNLDENAYSELLSNLTPKEQQLADSFTEILEAWHPEYNEKVQEEHSIDLGKEEGFFPTIRGGKGASDFVSMLSEFTRRSIAVPKSVRAKTKNKNPYVIKGADEVMQRYLTEKNKFIYLNDGLKKIDQIYSDPFVRELLEVKLGKGFLDVVDKFRKDLKKGVVDRSTPLDSRIDAFSSNFSVAVLGGIKVPLLMKQLISFPATQSFMPADSTYSDFYGAMGEFVQNRKELWPILKETGFIQERAGARDINILDNLRSKGLLNWIGDQFENNAEFKDKAQEFRVSPQFIQAMMLATSMGDVGAIALGGGAIYVAHKNQALGEGKTPEEANRIGLAKFIEASSATQQDAALEEQTAVIRSGVLGRQLGRFKQALNQYFQDYMTAWRNVLAGRMSGADFAKVMVNHHILLPNLFMAANTMAQLSYQYLGDGEDDDSILAEHAVATALGPVAGVYIIGDLIHELGKFFTKSVFELKDMPKHRWEDTIPALSPLTKFQRGFEDVMKGELTDASRDFLESSGEVFGVPTLRLLDFSDGTSAIIEGEMTESLLRAAGWSDYQMGKAKEGSGSTKRRSSSSRRGNRRQSKRTRRSRER